MSRTYPDRRQSFTCPSCHIRYEIKPPVPEPGAHIDLGTGVKATATFTSLRKFAAEFDRQTEGLHYSAEDFLDWLEPSVLGTERHRATTTMTSVQRWNGPGEAA